MVLCIPSYMRNTKLHIIKRFAFFLIMEVGLLLLYGARSNQIPCSLLNWNAYFGSLYMSGLHHHCQFSPRIYGFLKLFPFLFVYILCLLLYWNDKYYSVCDFLSIDYVRPGPSVYIYHWIGEMPRWCISLSEFFYLIFFLGKINNWIWKRDIMEIRHP